MIVLAVNAGSATIKLDLFAVADGDARRIAGRVAAVNSDEGATLAAFLPASASEPALVVHRIVHGGTVVTSARAADAAAIAGVESAATLAPLHNPHGLAWLRAARSILPAAAHFLVPDTGFFAALPERAQRYALPRALSDRLGIRRVGFHGIAHSAMARAWEQMRPAGRSGSRLITLQLGSGASIAAIADGAPVDVSMGFTPLEGLVMATRPGDLDAGILLHLMRTEGFDTERLTHLLNAESGLLGLGGSGDIRALLASDAPEAKGAVDIYCYRARKYVGAFLAALGGADAVLFGGGVGENNPSIRADIVAGLDWAGLIPDAAANSNLVGRTGIFSDERSTVALAVVEVDEAKEMVDQVIQLTQTR